MLKECLLLKPRNLQVVTKMMTQSFKYDEKGQIYRFEIRNLDPKTAPSQVISQNRLSWVFRRYKSSQGRQPDQYLGVHYEGLGEATNAMQMACCSNFAVVMKMVWCMCGVVSPNVLGTNHYTAVCVHTLKLYIRSAHTEMECTVAEFADKMFVYGLPNRNSREALRLDRTRYPCRRYPTCTTFATLFQRLKETEKLKLQYQDLGGRRSV